MKCVIKVTRGHVLLSFRTTATAVSLCSLQDDGAVHHHHISVSCSSSKVCSIYCLCLYGIDCYFIDIIENLFRLQIVTETLHCRPTHTTLTVSTNSLIPLQRTTMYYLLVACRTGVRKFKERTTENIQSLVSVIKMVLVFYRIKIYLASLAHLPTGLYILLALISSFIT